MQALADQLAAQKEGFLKKAPLDVVVIFFGAMAKLRASDLIDKALKQGDTAPLFKRQDVTGQAVSLVDRLTSGTAVVTFYRGVW